jgi:methyl-accepting chemotaxis protein
MHHTRTAPATPFRPLPRQDDLNALGRLVQRLFRSIDNVRLSTVSVVISVLTATLFAVGMAATVLTLNNVSTIASTWRVFDTGLGRRLDLFAAMRGHLGYGGLAQHWADWRGGDGASRQKVAEDLQALRAIQPAWLGAHPGPEESQALATVMRSLERYDRALAAGSPGQAVADDGMAQALTRIADILREERRIGAERVEETMWQLGATVGGVMLLSAILLMLLSLFFLWFTRFRVVAPIKASAGAMLRLAEGDKTIHVPFTEKTDEMGEMARTVEVFRESMIRADTLEADKRAADQALLGRAVRRAELTDAFGVSADRLLSVVDASVAKVRVSSEHVRKLAEETGKATTSVAATAEQAASNVQQVAAAAEQMAASIQEIGASVARSSTITRSAAEGITALGATMGELAGATQKIGEIVALIEEVAAQTNLLALNASIEAQRAGTAGKGFTVVANEVKSLAGQTARATGEIAEHIGHIQHKTAAAVNALKEVSSTVIQADEVVSTIASAIEEQSATTGEIVRNVTEAAESNAQVSDSMVRLSGDAGRVGATAAEMAGTIDDLDREAGTMQRTVRDFLAEVRKT